MIGSVCFCWVSPFAFCLCFASRRPPPPPAPHLFGFLMMRTLPHLAWLLGKQTCLVAWVARLQRSTNMSTSTSMIPPPQTYISHIAHLLILSFFPPVALALALGILSFFFYCYYYHYHHYHHYYYFLLLLYLWEIRARRGRTWSDVVGGRGNISCTMHDERMEIKEEKIRMMEKKLKQCV